MIVMVARDGSGRRAVDGVNDGRECFRRHGDRVLRHRLVDGLLGRRWGRRISVSIEVRHFKVLPPSPRDGDHRRFINTSKEGTISDLVFTALLDVVAIESVHCERSG